MKKVWIGLLVVLLVTMSDPVWGTGGKEQQQITDVGVEKPYTFKVLTFWSMEDKTMEGYIIRLILDAHKKEHPSFNYEWEVVSQFDVPAKISVLIASNDVPDFFSYEDGGALDSIVELNAIINMDKDLPKLGITLEDLCIPGAISAKRVLSNFPDIYSLPENMVIEGVWYNKPMFSKLGLTIPKTWQEMETLCDKLLVVGIQPFALSGFRKWPVTRWIMLYANRLEGATVHLDASRLVGGRKFTDEVFVKAAAKTQEMFQKGYFGKGYNSIDYPASCSMFGDSKTAMMYNGTWFASFLMDKNLNRLGEENVGYFPVPGIEGSKISLEDALKIEDISTNMALCFGKERFDKGGNHDFFKYFLTNFGKKQWEYGKFSPFITEVPEDLSPVQRIVMDRLNTAEDTCLWFEAKMGTGPTNVALDNSQLLAEGTMTPEDYCSRLAKAIEEFMKK